jgi:hypothetical protein
MPRKVFVAGDPLTAAQVNTNLMDQSVMRFASAAARDTAIPSPTEGMMAYLDDSNWLTSYNGSSWVFLAGDRPYFFGQTTSQTLGSGGTASVTTTQNIVSNRGSFTVSSPGVLLVPQTGVYSITGTVEFGANATGFREVLLNVNGGTSFKQRGMAVTTAATNSFASISQTSYLSAGNYVALQALQNSGSSLAIIGTISITYLGA